MKESGGASRYLILGMLARMPLTGYTIQKWIHSEYSHFWQASYGQIYPALKALVADGLATSSNAPNTNGRGQIEYCITNAGRQALSNWLEKEPETEKLRYEILLKISFGQHTQPGILLGHLDDFIKRNEKQLQEMNQFLDLFDHLPPQQTDPTYSRLTALCGAYLYTAMRDWALEAKNIIQQKEADLQ